MGAQAPPSIPPGTDLWKTPAGKPPPGVVPNFVDPVTNKNIPQVTLSILVIIATMFVALRVFVQFYLAKHKWGWDDATLLVALPLQITYSGIIIWLSEVGYIARHVWDVPLAVPLLELPYWTRFINSFPQPITGLVKLALLFFYLRLFGPDRVARILTICGIVFVSIVYFAFTLTFALLPSVNNPVVIKLWIVQAAVNVVTDIFLFCLPVSTIIKLQMSRNRRLAILAIFSTGLAAVLLSSLTLYWRHNTPRGIEFDQTWSAATIFTVSLAEIDIGIICACMLLLAPVLPKIGLITKNWTGYIRSRAHLLGRSTNKRSNDQSNGPYEFDSGVDSAPVGTGYLELDERSQKVTQNNTRKHWFDRSIVGVSTVGSQPTLNDDHDRRGLV